MCPTPKKITNRGLVGRRHSPTKTATHTLLLKGLKDRYIVCSSEFKSVCVCVCDCLLQKSKQSRISLLERQISLHQSLLLCCARNVRNQNIVFFSLILNWVNILRLNSSIHGIYVILVSTWCANVMLNHLILMEKGARGLRARDCVFVYMCTSV